ncbi:MAG: AAA family ATPase, partial [Bdellovibrionia bacterium]
LNFDLLSDRREFKNYQNLPLGPDCRILFIDEIQKLSGWRNLLKGYFEKFKKTQFIVSGSAAFELLRGDRGDSLAGRTVPIRLEPLTFREYLFSVEDPSGLPSPLTLSITKNIQNLKPLIFPNLRKHWENYFLFGGFPELLSHQNLKRTSIWLREYINALLTKDLRDLQGLKDTERVEQVLSLILESTGSTYSLRSLSETVLCSPNTIKSDILALKKLLWGFELSSSQKSIARTLQRPKKLYPVDWILQSWIPHPSSGAVFENAVICALHRHCGFENFTRVRPLNLNYFQNYANQEIDAVIEEGKKALITIEIKLKAKSEHFSQLENLREKLQAPYAVLVTNIPGVFEWINPQLLHISVEQWCGLLF